MNDQIVTVLLVALVSFLAGWSIGKLRIADQKSRADSLQGEVNQLKDMNARLEKFGEENQALETQLTNINTAMDNLRRDTIEFERQRQESAGALSQQLSMMNETAVETQEINRKIISALTSSASRGKWGEMQLERLFEYAGMERNVHYFPQETSVNETAIRRPDFKVKLSTGGIVFVDAKFPFDAYWLALDEKNDSQREQLMKQHAKAVKDRARELSNKGYQQHEADSADFAVLFLPFESLYYAALEADPNLITDIFSKNIVIATPSSMMALLHTIKLGITQQKSAENASRIQKHAIELLKRFNTFNDYIVEVDKSVGKTVENLGKLKASYTTRLLPQARAMQELGIEPPNSRKNLPVDPTFELEADSEDQI